jgi:transcriptional regulator with XRE-family HTH domain
VSRHYCRLITELIAFTQAEGGTLRDLATELAVDETELIRFRSGERSPSKRVLTKILARYGEMKFVRDLLVHHFAAECQSGYLPPENPFADADLPAKVVADLQQYVRGFAVLNARGGRGLYIVSPDAGALSRTLRALGYAFELEGVRFVTIRADQRLDARALRAALAAPLVLVERADFASETVADVLQRRADLIRPCVVTSMREPDAIADAYLRRVVVSTMACVRLSAGAPAPIPSPTLHDAA